ncbi:recombinase family protein [uncultured Veillonella sp.]|uniref:recombinase family protein n=1 Tax=uncultured Veillonella sp. TaxID=159268 RepID=UPI0025D0B5C5|nr:recombinase family protein [uncultured Veillonella sp.]MDY3973191.1 recombinase family protein [Veillonella caviae]
MKRVALYIRVSNEEQSMHGYSLQAQENRLRQYAYHHNYSIVDCYRDEGISARSCPGRRKEFSRMLKHVQQGRIDCILFIKLDRWFRNVSDYYTYQAILDTYGVQWEATEEDYNTNTAQGRLYLNIKLSIAQNESDTTSERIHFVFSDKKSRREAISGKLPLGYTIQAKRILPDTTAPIIKAVFEYYKDCGSIRQTQAFLLNNYHIKRSYPAMTKLLRNKKYIGTFYDIAQYAPPIVPIQLFTEVQHMLNCHNRKDTQGSNHFLFAGLLRCPHCQHSLVGLARHYKTSSYIYYQCPNSIHNPQECSNKTLYKEPLIEATLLNALPVLIKQCFIPENSKESSFVFNHHNYRQWSLVTKKSYWQYFIDSIILPYLTKKTNSLAYAIPIANIKLKDNFL